MIAERIDELLGLVRRCVSCGEEWPDVDEFYREYAGICNACVDEQRRRERDAHAARMRDYRARRRETRGLS